MANEIMNVQTQVNAWNGYKQVASEMIKSGFLPRALNTPEKVITVIMTGRELNVPMMEALRGIHVIDNKPALSPQLMLAMINRSGVLEDLQIDSQTTYCKVTMKRKERSVYTAHFGVEEAKAMNLLWKDNYKKQAPNMFKWRAISAAARVVCPDIIGGLYTTEEVQSHTDMEEQMSVIEQQADFSQDRGSYDEWRDAFFIQTKRELEQMQEASNVQRWGYAHKKEMDMLTDQDRTYIEQLLAEQQSALIRGDGNVVSPQKDLEKASTKEEYLERAKEYDNIIDLRAWFKTVQIQAQEDLSTEDFTILVDELSKMRDSFESSQKIPKESNFKISSMMAEISDYLRESVDIEQFKERKEECWPDIANLMGKNKKWMNDEIKNIEENLRARK